MRTPTLATLLVAAVAASQLGATDCGTIIKDHGFDHWCGDQLCYWKVERGEIRRAPTWHASDDGVELVGADVAIAQMTAVTSHDTSCIEFKMLADVEASAEVRLEADVFGDGSVEWSERIPTSDWRRVSLRIGLRGGYDGVRFRITKTGPGRAVLAQIGAWTASDCPSFVDVVDRPLGASCWVGDDCASGVCAGWVCSGCAVDGDCADGEVCGRAADVPGHLHDALACVPAGSRAVGERCARADECASGACNGLLCGECGSTAMCGGAACGPAEPDLPVSVCEPGTGGRPAGAACVVDAQCAGGACAGRPLGFCGDDRDRPCFEDAHCPFDDSLVQQRCTFVAVAGGTCQ